VVARDKNKLVNSPSLPPGAGGGSGIVVRPAVVGTRVQGCTLGVLLCLRRRLRACACVFPSLAMSRRGWRARIVDLSNHNPAAASWSSDHRIRRPAVPCRAARVIYGWVLLVPNAGVVVSGVASQSESNIGVSVKCEFSSPTSTEEQILAQPVLVRAPPSCLGLGLHSALVSRPWMDPSMPRSMPTPRPTWHCACCHDKLLLSVLSIGGDWM